MRNKKTHIITLTMMTALMLTGCSAVGGNGIELDSIRSEYENEQEEKYNPGDTHNGQVPDNAAIDSAIRTFYINRTDFSSVTEDEIEAFKRVYLKKGEEKPEDKKMLYDAAYRTHMFEGFDEPNLTKKQRDTIIADMFLNRGMIADGGMIVYSVVVDEDAIKIDGEKAEVPYSGIHTVEKGTIDSYLNIQLGEEWESIELSKKDGVWYLEPTGILASTRGILASLKVFG